MPPAACTESRCNRLKYKESYRWLICVAATIILFCTLGLTISSCSIYLPYIREHKKLLHTKLMINGTLYTHLAEINKQAEEMFSELVNQIKIREPSPNN